MNPSILSSHHSYPPFCASLLVGVLLAAFGPLSHAEETMLGTVNVRDTRSAAGLHLDEPTQGGSRTGVTAKELPASLEILDGETIRERGDTQIGEAIVRTTGLTNNASPGNGGLSFSSRGFAGTGSVGIAEDGVRLQTASGTQNYPSNVWGYERIEVLRGPASIVYGSGTIGATINAVRKEPSRTRRYELMTGLGTDGYKQLGVGAAGPVGEIASYRVDAYGFHNDGYRDLGKAHGGKLMSRLRLQPNSDLRIDLTADYSLTHPERYFGTPYAPGGRIIKSLRDKNYNAADAELRYEDTRLRAKADWRANDWLSLSNELYYLETERIWKNIEGQTLNLRNNTIERSDYLYIQHNLDQTGNRLEASFKGAGHRAVAGWEIAKINFRHTNNSPYRGSSIVSVDHPNHGSWNSPDPIRASFDTDTTLNAFYVEDAWQINDRWLLMAGIRRDLARISRTQLISGTDFSARINGTAWRLGLTHHLTRDTSVYGQISAGHDPVTSLVTMNLSNARFKLTTGRQVEVGLKQTLGGGLGEWTAALYRIEKDDIITRDPNNPRISVQGGSMHSQGIELAANISPVKNWRFEGNYTYLTAKFDELNESSGGRSVSRAGNTPSNVPQQVANLWGHYRFGQWQASLGLRHVGKRYRDNANTFTMKAYTVADASLTWHYSDRLTFRLLGRNLADKVYATNAYNTQFFLGEPRRFDLIAEMKF